MPAKSISICTYSPHGQKKTGKYFTTKAKNRIFALQFSCKHTRTSLKTKNNKDKMAKQKSNASADALNMNEALTRSEAFVIKYKKQLLIGLAAIIVIVGGGLLLKNYYFEPREAKAQTLLTQGLPYMGQQDYDKALKGEGKFPGYIKIASQYSFTDAGNLAKLYAGLAYAHKGDTKNAIKYLEDWSPADDHSVSPAGISALANCYAANKQVDKAIDTFKKAADKADNPALSPLFLLEAGKLLEHENKKDEALKLYQQIKEDYPTCQLAMPQGSPNDVIGDAEIDRYIERASK